MSRKSFRWTRKTYMHADWMARFYGRHIYELPERPPPLLQRFLDLWERHRQSEDPPLVPLKRRPGHKDYDEIPF